MFPIALRLYPVVPTNARQAVVDTVLPLGGGEDGKSPLFIPAGRAVAWNLYAMHRRRDLYGDDAEEFKPERWETLRPSWEYLPFNGGPRVCIGRKSPMHSSSSPCEVGVADAWFCRATRSYRSFLYDHPPDAGVQGHREPRSKPVDGEHHDHLFRSSNEGGFNTCMMRTHNCQDRARTSISVVNKPTKRVTSHSLEVVITILSQDGGLCGFSSSNSIYLSCSSA